MLSRLITQINPKVKVKENVPRPCWRLSENLPCTPGSSCALSPSPARVVYSCLESKPTHRKLSKIRMIIPISQQQGFLS